jgi:arylsulfatase A-like enzyme
MLSAWRLGIMTVVGLLGGLPLVFLTHYRSRFGYDARIVLFGATLMIATSLLLAWLALVLAGRQRRPLRRRILGVGLTALIVGMMAIYAGAYISNAVWGDTLTWPVAVTFATQIEAVLAFLPVSATHKAIGLAGAATSGLALLTLTLVLSARFANALVTRLDDWLVAIPQQTAARARQFRTALTTAMLLSVGACLGLGWWHAARLQGEPISTFFTVFGGPASAKLSYTRLATVIQDRDTRAAYPKSPTFERRNVIVIFSDALRADRMGVSGYHRPTTPFLSSLAAKGQLHRVEMALSSCSESYCGIASTLTGRPFHEISVRSLKLHQLLRDQGYRVNFYLSGDHRGWGYLQDFYGADVDGMYDSKTLASADINDDENLMRPLQQLVPSPTQPHFMYFFLMSSHISGRKHPEFERYRPTRIDGARIMTFWNELAGQTRVDGKVEVPKQRLRPDEFQALSNRYDNGVLQSDAYIKRIFETLDAKGYLANSLIVILGDHGDSLGEKGHIGHTRFLYQEDIHIPLLIYDQDVTRYKNSRFATQADIAPTILQRLGLPVPAGWSEHSLLQPARDRITVHQTRRGKESCYAATQSTATSLHKYMRCDGQSGGHGELLFDLTADPTEQTNLMATADAALIQRLRRELDALVKPNERAADAAAKQAPGGMPLTAK